MMQTVEIDLAHGETVDSQTSCMCWMNDLIDMDTHTGGGILLHALAWRRHFLHHRIHFAR
jgi:uncharacterized protein (AIM24 family)